MPATRPEKPITRQEIKRLIRQRANVSSGGSSGSSSGGSSGGSGITEIIAGVALDGGGTVSPVTIDHADSAVTPGTFGDAVNAVQVTVDQQGHITSITEVSTAGTATVDVEDEGMAEGTFGTINFVGAGVTATDAGGGVVDVTIPGAALEVQDEGVTETDPATIINFTGAGVTATDQGGGEVEVNIPGFSGLWWFSPPELADFTGVDVGTVAGTVESDDADIGMSIYTTLTGADSARLRVKTAPSAPFSIRAKVMVGAGVTGSTGPVCGLIVRNSTTGQRFSYGIANAIGAGAHTRGYRQSTGTTFNAGGVIQGSGGPGQIWSGEIWFRIDISAGLAADVYVSADGKNWHHDQSFTQANTVGSGLDQVGFGVSKLDGGGPDSVSMSIQFYDEV